MVLEEALLFYDEDDADIFIKFLRDKNCRVQKMTESSVFEETVMSGTIGNLISVIDKAMEWKIPKTHQSPAEGEEPPADPGGPAPPDRENAIMILHAKMLANLKSIRDHIDGIMARSNPGDIIWSNEDLNRMKVNVSACLEDGSEDDLVGKLSHDIFIHDCLQIMENNSVVETRPEGISLIKKIDPNDLTIERRAWEPDEIDHETFKKYHIALTHTIYYETATRVIIDPRIHFTCNPKDVEKVLDDLEADDDSAADLIRNLNLKSLAIDSIMNVIETAGRIALPDLIREMDSVTRNEVMDDIRLVLNSSSPFISGIVNDLRKIGVIEGNDRKIRVVR
jgi:hypothetical protein